MSIRRFCRAIKNTASNAKKESVGELLKKNKITLISNEEMTVEGEVIVCKYDSLQIEIRIEHHNLLISGENLYLCFIKSNILRITGFITEISFK